MSKPEIFILYIEDDRNLHDGFIKEAEMFNEENDDLIIHVSTAQSIEEAERELYNNRFDAIVTDLKIEPGSPEKDAVTIGNDFIKRLKSISPCPIAILTGKTTDVEESALDKSSMAKFTKEGEAEVKIFNWIKEKLHLIRLMRESFKILNRELAPLFHGGVASRISAGGGSIPADSALRMILENVADSILTVNSTTSCHPQESYIYPVLRSKIMTGDIILHEGATWVVMTPACDIARCDANYPVLIAKCNDHPKYEKYLESARTGNFDSLQKLINQANNLGTHFLPPLNKGDAPLIVNFEELNTAIYSAIDSSKIVAAISPKFLPNLIHRFSAFIGRPGAPDIDANHCLAHSTK